MRVVFCCWHYSVHCHSVQYCRYLLKKAKKYIYSIIIISVAFHGQCKLWSAHFPCNESVTVALACNSVAMGLSVNTKVIVSRRDLYFCIAIFATPAETTSVASHRNLTSISCCYGSSAIPASFGWSLELSTFLTFGLILEPLI